MAGSKQLTLKTAVWPFILVIATQLMFAGLSVKTLSAIRASVATEGLWSKAQQTSIYFLTLYVTSGDDGDFRRYQAAMSALLAMGDTRAAIAKPEPDIAVARAGFLQLGSEPADIPGMIWIFSHFHGLGTIAVAFDEWDRASKLIVRTDELGATIRAEGPPSRMPEAQRAAYLGRIGALNAETIPHANAFSRALGVAAQLVENQLIVANLALAIVLAGLTVWHVRQFLRQRKAVEAELEWQASHDSLTGIANRRGMAMRLDAALAPGRTATALVYLDIDQFKIINDTCGHAAGDKLLQAICGPLQRTLRPGDFIARLGGDEFSVLLQDCTVAQALTMAERLLATVRKVDFTWGQRTFKVTVSVGLVHTDQGLVCSEEMMQGADMACYMAKEKGRNRVHMHRAEDRDLIRHAGEMNWVQRIHQALQEDRFCLYAQEIAPLGDRGTDGLHLELLIRLRDESGALIPPTSFLPAAERFGLMGLIDRWVVRTAFRLLAERSRDAGAEPVDCCAINLSGATIGDQDFLGFLKGAFREFGISPRAVCFEITETAAITNLDAAKAFVGELRAFGCRFSLDDFGSGMSSFGHLKHLPVDFLKIDGSFVRNMLNNKIDRAMVEMVKNLGHIMGQQIIAEFVENEDLVAALETIGVDYGQGYGIAKPKPFDLDFRSADAASRKVPLRLIA